MNSRSLSNLAVVGFVLLGAIFFGLRYHALREAAIARQDSLWELTYEITFKATTDPTSEPSALHIAIPFNTPHCQVLSEEWTNAGLKSKRVVLNPAGTRELRLSTTRADTFAPQLDFVLRLSPRAVASRDPGLETLSRDTRDLYLRKEDDLPTNDPKVKETVQSLTQGAKTDWAQIEAIFNLCMAIETDLEAPGGVDVALTDKKHTPIMRAKTMVTLCRAMDFPARLVTGFEIEQNPDAKPRVWVEVYYDHEQRWVPFDTENGYIQTLPADYVPVRRGGDSIIRTVEATINPEDGERYSIRRLPADPRVANAETPHPMQIFNLKRLPVPMHTVMSLLLLLPFGALITALMRNVIGVQTFGTFAPALLAMSFIYADLETGLAIFLIVVVVGLLGRWWLERLRLLMVPRLSIILTLVILCVVFSVSSFDFMGLTPSAQAVLLPMVILTILIERFHVTVEEDGLMFALKLTLGTLVVSALCYMVLGWEKVGAWVLTYPEAHFFTIAAFILLGRYAGYRITELWRFRDLVEPSEPVR